MYALEARAAATAATALSARQSRVDGDTQAQDCIHQHTSTSQNKLNMHDAFHSLKARALRTEARRASQNNSMIPSQGNSQIPPRGSNAEEMMGMQN